MTSFLAFLLSLAIISSVVSTPTVHIRDSPITLPIVKRFAESGVKNIIARDRARARQILSRSQGTHDGSFKVKNGGTGYIASVGVGSPPTYYDLLVDTGSSNTWVGAGKPYVKTKTSINTHQNVSLTYEVSNFTGTEYLDTVTLTKDLVIHNQSIGVASSSFGFNGYDGVFGIGPVDLTNETVSNTGLVPTVPDNLFAQHTIDTEVFGLYFQPLTKVNETTGELDFGHVDLSKTTSPINYVPITSNPNTSAYWGIDLSVSYDKTPIVQAGSGIVDSGIALILLNHASFETYQNATGAVLDSKTGFLKLTSQQYDNLSSLDFNIGNVTYSLSPNGQIVPRQFNTILGGDADSVYLVVFDIGFSTLPFDILLGYSFLERFYAVFDKTNQRIGFAKTAFTDAITN